MTEMNEKGDEANVPREPWQRLLEDRADGPPETTDARIRAAARRAVAPRGRHWWLPASLAASLVLAVLIARHEVDTSGRMPSAETGRAEDAAIDARALERRGDEPAREAGQWPAAPAPEPSKQRDEAESDAYVPADPGPGEAAAVSSQEDASRAQAAPAPTRAMKAPLPEPEAWYAAIEKLRREGRAADADREIERLRKAYPGWLESRLGEEEKPP